MVRQGVDFDTRASVVAFARSKGLTPDEAVTFARNLPSNLRNMAANAATIQAEFDRSYAKVLVLAAGDPELARLIDDAMANGKIAIICGCP